MAVRVTVRFAPATTAPYADSLTVVTETGAFSVPLSATLPAPELTLPLTLHAGVCLPYDRVTVTVPFSNTGARARFRLFPEAIFERMQQEQEGGGGAQAQLRYANPDADLWEADAEVARAAEGRGGDARAAEALGSADEPLLTAEYAVMGALTVEPVEWDLAQGGEPASLTITYAPTAVGDADEGFVVVCSNGDVVRYRLVGECTTLQVGITSLEGAALAEPCLLTSLDAGYDAPAPLPPTFSASVAAAVAGAAGGVAPSDAEGGGGGSFGILGGLAALLDAGTSPLVLLPRTSSVARLTPGPADGSASTSSLGRAATVAGTAAGASTAILPGAVAAAGVVAALPPPPPPSSSSTGGTVRPPSVTARFDALFPGTLQRKTFTISNGAAVAVPFAWRVAPETGEPPAVRELDEAAAALHAELRTALRTAEAIAAGGATPLFPASAAASLSRITTAAPGTRGTRRTGRGAGVGGGGGLLGAPAPLPPPPDPSPFAITPASGVLPPYGAVTFSLSFAPWRTGLAEAQAELLLLDVPVPPLQIDEDDAAAAADSDGGRAASPFSTASGRSGGGGRRRRRRSSAARRGDYTAEPTEALALLSVARSRSDGSAVQSQLQLRDAAAALLPTGADAGGVAFLPPEPSDAEDAAAGGADPLASSRQTGPLRPDTSPTRVSMRRTAGTTRRAPLSRGTSRGGLGASRGGPGAGEGVGGVARGTVRCGRLFMQGSGRSADAELLPAPTLRIPTPLLPGQQGHAQVREEAPLLLLPTPPPRTCPPCAQASLVNHGDAELSFHFEAPPGGAADQRGLLCHAVPRIGIVPPHGGSVDVHIFLTCADARGPGDVAAQLHVALFHGDGYARAADAEVVVTLPPPPLGGGEGDLLLPPPRPPPSPELRHVAAAPDPHGHSRGGSARTQQQPSTAATSSGRRRSSLQPGGEAGSVAVSRGGSASPTSRLLLNAPLPPAERSRPETPDSPLGPQWQRDGGPLFHKAGVLVLDVLASIALPRVAFAAEYVDVGLLGTARATSQTLRLHNPAPVPAAFALRRVVNPSAATGSALAAATAAAGGSSDCVPHIDDASGRTTRLVFRPAQGVLPAFGAIDVTVMLTTGSRPERLRALLCCESDDPQRRSGGGGGGGLPLSFLRLDGEVQAPKVSLSAQSVNFGVAFVGVAVRRRLVISNMANLPADFSWDPYVGTKPPPPLTPAEILQVRARERGAAAGSSLSLAHLPSPHRRPCPCCCRRRWCSLRGRLRREARAAGRAASRRPCAAPASARRGARGTS